jgi:hypothetical protein
MDDVDLARAYTMMSKAVRFMCTNTDDLRSRWVKATESQLGGTWAGHFPDGLKHRFEGIEPSLGKLPESEEAAKTLIEKLIALCDDSEMELYHLGQG